MSSAMPARNVLHPAVNKRCVLLARCSLGSRCKPCTPDAGQLSETHWMHGTTEMDPTDMPDTAKLAMIKTWISALYLYLFLFPSRVFVEDSLCHISTVIFLSVFTKSGGGVPVLFSSRCLASLSMFSLIRMRLDCAYVHTLETTRSSLAVFMLPEENTDPRFILDMSAQS